MIDNEKKFYQDSQALIDALFEEAPTVATMLGDHRFDDRLADYSAAGIARQRKMLGQWLDSMQNFGTAAWSLDARIDRTLMVQIIKQFIRGYDVIQSHRRDPGEVVNECLNGIYLLTIRNFAPLPVRLKSILGRLREVPRVLAEGRALIDPPAVPPIWAEIALDTTRQSIGLFAGFLPALAAAAPDIQDEIVAASQAAAAALTSATTVMFVGLAVAIVVGVLLAFFITRGITKPLNRMISGLNEGADQVNDAAGQVSSVVPDELASTLKVEVLSSLSAQKAGSRW